MSLKVKSPGLIISSSKPAKNIWTDGSDEEVVEIVKRAQAGELDIKELWNIGDRRKVHLSAMSETSKFESHAEQDVYLVLMNKGGVQFTDDKECNFIVGLENSLIENGGMNSSGNNTGSWKNSDRRRWCNSVFYNAIPSTLRPIFKQMKIITAVSYNGTSVETTEDYFALPAAREIFSGECDVAGDNTGYSNLTEWNTLSGPWEYYTIQHNKNKYYGTDEYNATLSLSSQIAYNWWERSPYYDNTTHFCFVNYEGGAGAKNAGLGQCGLAPFGAI